MPNPERASEVEVSMSARANAEQSSLDVAIIGAGVSGLYTGWRLIAPEFVGSDTPPTTAIFEMDQRIGGRLWSANDLPGLPGVSAEIGGMRYMEYVPQERTGQGIVSKLIEKFKLAPVEFSMGDQNLSLNYLRGRHFRNEDWKRMTRGPCSESAAVHGNELTNPYNLRKSALGKSPDQLFTEIVERVLRANKVPPPKTREEWDRVKPKLTYDQGPDKGERLESMGFWNLIEQELGQEGYELLSQGGGYYSNTINWNAAEALPYVTGDFGATVKYKTIEGGFDQIAKKLATAYTDSGGRILLGYQLITFERTLADESPRKYRLTFKNTGTGEKSAVYADRIVLAMPRRSLELLSESNLLSAADPSGLVRHNIRSVIGEPSFKLLAFFREPGSNPYLPWWQRSRWQLSAGRSITDLPMRQCYYFASNAQTRCALMLASYNDMSTVDFWKVLEVPDSGHAELQQIATRQHGDERFVPTLPAQVSQEFETCFHDAIERYEQAPKRMVEHALVQLAELHAMETVPRPYFTLYKNWNDDPYGGGYHAWKAWYDVGKVMKFMRKPLPDEQVHICGEAYSDQQGWVEGAFCVAELMLQEHLGSRPPEFLKGYYLGR